MPDENVQILEPANAAPEKPLFTDEAQVEPCVGHICTNGHPWPIKFSIVGCPGCGSPVLAIKLENCPACNEPASQTTLRVDFTNNQIGVQPVCRGADTRAEVLFVDLERRLAPPEPQKEPDDANQTDAQNLEV